jgi:hypothetical protein
MVYYQTGEGREFLYGLLLHRKTGKGQNNASSFCDSCTGRGILVSISCFGGGRQEERQRFLQCLSVQNTQLAKASFFGVSFSELQSSLTDSLIRTGTTEQP